MIFMWRFLCLFLLPLQSTNEQVFLDLPHLTIVQNPHACCKNLHVQIMKTITLWNLPGTKSLCSFCCPFRNFNSSNWSHPNSSQTSYQARTCTWHVPCHIIVTCERFWTSLQASWGQLLCQMHATGTQNTMMSSE
jgi:hypothetical protein